MSRRMSCSMTIEAVRNRSKIVTRRHVDTWQSLKVGDHLTLIEKGMGLPKGAKQVVLAEVEIVSVREEPLAFIFAEGVYGPTNEGLPHMSPHEFISFWCEGHGYRNATDAMDVPCRRIEWRYFDDPNPEATASTLENVECPTCRGSGVLGATSSGLDGYQRCDDCNGTGRTPDFLTPDGDAA